MPSDSPGVRAAGMARLGRIYAIGGNAMDIDREERKLRSLEGLGYVAALMIGLAGLTDLEVLRYFNILGLVFAIIVIVRLMVMNVSMGLMQQLYDAPGALDSDTMGQSEDVGD